MTIFFVSPCEYFKAWQESCILHGSEEVGALSFMDEAHFSISFYICGFTAYIFAKFNNYGLSFIKNCVGHIQQQNC